MKKDQQMNLFESPKKIIPADEAATFSQSDEISAEEPGVDMEEYDAMMAKTEGGVPVKTKTRQERVKEREGALKTIKAMREQLGDAPQGNLYKKGK